MNQRAGRFAPGRALVTPKRRNTVTKIGRPTIRKNGVAFSPAEKMRRYRARQKLKRAQRCEWYIPRKYVEAARAVMGKIDLDPASSEIANQVVKARTYFTIEDDGLSKEWRGNVLLNPPYSRYWIERFADKLLAEIAAGRVKQAVLIVHPKTGIGWFSRVAGAATSICLGKGRIQFWRPDGSVGKSPMTSNAFLYYGRHIKRFEKLFKDFGIIR